MVTFFVGISLIFFQAVCILVCAAAYSKHLSCTSVLLGPAYIKYLKQLCICVQLMYIVSLFVSGLPVKGMKWSKKKNIANDVFLVGEGSD
jgi:hypothetical protein